MDCLSFLHCLTIQSLQFSLTHVNILSTGTFLGPSLDSRSRSSKSRSSAGGRGKDRSRDKRYRGTHTLGVSSRRNRQRAEKYSSLSDPIKEKSDKQIEEKKKALAFDYYRAGEIKFEVGCKHLIGSGDTLVVMRKNIPGSSKFEFVNATDMIRLQHLHFVFILSFFFLSVCKCPLFECF